MSVLHSLIGRRRFLAFMLSATIGVVLPATAAMVQPSSDASIRPFKFHALPQEAPQAFAQAVVDVDGY